MNQQNPTKFLGLLFIAVLTVSAVFFISQQSPTEQIANRPPEPPIRLKPIVVFTEMAHNKVNIGKNNGNCVIPQTNFRQFKRRARKSTHWKYFYGLPDPNRNGAKSEYLNLMYVDAFDKILIGSKGNQNTFVYKARVDFAGSGGCPILRSIKRHGTEPFSAHVYNNMVKKLSALGLGSEDEWHRKTRLINEYTWVE